MNMSVVWRSTPQIVSRAQKFLYTERNARELLAFSTNIRTLFGSFIQ